MDDITIENDHNVYILGAGFSRDAGLPLIHDFIDMMRSALDGDIPEHCKKAIKEVLKFRKKAMEAAYVVAIDVDNIEDLFSLASALDIHGEGVMKYIPNAIAATLHFAYKTPHKIRVNSSLPTGIQTRLRLTDDVINPDTGATVSYGNKEVEAYQFYVASMLGLMTTENKKIKNTFITFNYDTLLEDALVSLQVPFRYPFRSGYLARDSSARSVQNRDAEGKEIDVIKIHGSVNFAPMHFDAGSGDKDALMELGTFSDVAKENHSPFLIPPTWNKSMNSYHGQSWNKAISALSSATRVAIIGFSIPETDMHFRHLLAAGLKDSSSLRNIHICNPKCEEMLPRINKLFKSNLAFKNPSSEIPFSVYAQLIASDKRISASTQTVEQFCKELHSYSSSWGRKTSISFN